MSCFDTFEHGTLSYYRHFYTTLKLIDNLLQHRMDTETEQEDAAKRSGKQKKIEKGRNVNLFKWKSLCNEINKKDISILSTIHNIELIELERIHETKKLQ